MLFNSYIFILFFLPITLIGYFLLNHVHKEKLAMTFLFLMSLCFYGFFNRNYVSIILFSILLNYTFYRLLKKVSQYHEIKTISFLNKIKKTLLFIGISSNIGFLFYFKYYNFFMENINVILKKDFVFQTIILPLGISFFTFQQIAFLVDSYKKSEEINYSILDYSLYVSFFPYLSAGPIVFHYEVVTQFRDNRLKQFNWDHFSYGIYLFSLGLGKKVLLADLFGRATNAGFYDVWKLNGISALVVMLSYTFQIYFDFSGYSDMAIGIGKMFNISLPTNFNSPYKAKNILEFWERWHITLTRFFTKYVYIPLGGIRRGVARTYINTMIIFLISGFWHGANWTFVLWGLLHGCFFVFTKATKNWYQKIPILIQKGILFIFINITWSLFRIDSIRLVFSFFNRFRVWNTVQISANVLKQFGGNWYLWFYLILSGILCFIAPNAKEIVDKRNFGKKEVVITVALLVFSVLSISDVSTFVYFNF